MGLSCKKQTGKFQSIMRKMENQLEAERKAAKEKKEAKKSKTNISKQVDICPSCQNIIARIVNLMRYVNINADKIEEDVYISLKNASIKNSKGE